MDLGSVLVLASGATALGAGIWKSFHDVAFTSLSRQMKQSRVNEAIRILREVEESFPNNRVVDEGDVYSVYDDQGNRIRILSKGPSYPAEQEFQQGSAEEEQRQRST
jgi:hypothetical protein